MNEHCASHILCVDDEEMNLALYRTFLKGVGYTVDTAGSGLEAVEQLLREPADLIILDLMMPDMNGFEVLSLLRSNSETENIPVIVATAALDRDSKLQVLQSGATDFLQKPLDRIELLLRVKNLLKVKEHQDLLENFNSRLQQEVAAKTNALYNSYIETIHRLVLAAEFKDEDTAEHISRIARYTRCLAEAMELPEELCRMLYYAAPMHDVGKIGIPDHILTKVGELTEEEQAIMQQHPLIGTQILEGSTARILQLAESIALTHHERWDGSGYPNGLSGDAIPLEGRIVALVDVYDGLRMPRSYKEGLDHQQACSAIFNGDGRTEALHFDPKVLAAFRRVHQRFDEIFGSEVVK